MIDFVWRVPRDGYRWCRQEGGELIEVADGAPADPSVREFLVPITDGEFRDALPDDAPDCARWLYRETRPLAEHTGLFREFAETKRTRAGIRGFANRYGNLGAESDALGELDDPAEPVEPPGHVETMEDYATWLRETQREYRCVDSRARWSDEIERMRRCVTAWDAAREATNDRSKMEGVTQIVNNALYENRVGVALDLMKRGRRQVAIRTVPVSLAGALWAQLALAMDGNHDYRQCSQCRRWFAADPDTTRRTRLYCGDACRARHYRAKKERARELRDKGWKLTAIAAELDTDVTTLKGWFNSK